MTLIRAILPFSVTLGLLASGLIGWWYVWPRMRAATVRDALIPLLFPHVFRYLGLSFLIHGVTTTALDPRFAVPTAYGDLLTSILALVAIAALRANARLAIPLVWIFSLVGIIDFTSAFVRGLTLLAPGDFGATYYIPMVIVPPLIISHFLIIARLRVGAVDPTRI